MKTLIIFVAGLMAVSPAFAKAKTVNLDTKQSHVKWIGKKVTGQHNGTVAIKSGKIQLDGKDLKGGKFEIDMKNIVVEDLKDKEYNDKLTNHLKSDDFFGVAKHPVSTFEITKVQPLSGAADATHEVTGKLTIKGHTEEVTFPAKVSVEDKKATAQGKIKVDRTKYNIRYGSGKFFDNLGDKMISDDFEIELDLTSKI
jgi:polyisoprenoid-binding protein YceI